MIPLWSAENDSNSKQSLLCFLYLQFRFMVEENERLLAGSRVGAAPAGASARTPRQSRWVGCGQQLSGRLSWQGLGRW